MTRSPEGGKPMFKNVILGVALGVLAAGAASAAEPEKCKLVRMSDPGWSDIASTNALFGTVLKGLGYQQKIETLAVPVTYKSVGDNRIDVFLGNWMPAQTKFIEPLVNEKKLD